MKTSRSTRVPARAAAWRWCAIVVLGVLAIVPGAARAQDLPATPPPIRSKDLERLLQAMEAGPESRAAAVAAFDAYVDRWQRLRDETIRPLQASMAAALAKVPAMPSMEDAEELAGGVVHTAGAEAEAEAEAYQARVAEWQRAWEDREASKKAALEPFRARAASVSTDVRAAERALFEAVRATAASDASRAAVDREELVRRRRIAVASREDLRGQPWMPLTFPSLPTGAPADDALRARLDARIMAWERASAEALEQGASAEEFVRRRLLAAAEVAAMLPADVGAPWIRGVRGRAANQLGLWGIDPSAGLASALGDRATPEVRARMDRWADERDALLVEALAAGDAEAADDVAADDAAADDEAAPSAASLRIALMQRDQELSDTALAELAALIDDPAFGKEALQMKLMQESWKRRPDDEGGPRFAGESVMRGAMARSRAAVGGDQPEDGEEADPFGPDNMEWIASAGTIRRADLEPVRARLGIPDEATSLWNQLCDDLVATSAEVDSEMKSFIKEAEQDRGAGRGLVERRRAIGRRSEAAEMAWFDAVAAAFPSIPAEALDAERGRRAVRRAVEGGSIFLVQVRMVGNRWIDADLDRAADACSSDARRAAARPLADWRGAQAAAVNDLVACSERMFERMVAAHEAMQAAAADGNEAGIAAFDGFQRVQADYQREVDEVSRRAEATLAASTQAVAEAMPRPQGAVFRRGVRRQMHPEVYRDQDRVDAAIDAALGDPSLTPDQRGAAAAAWGESQTRFEGIAERLIAQSAKTDRAMADMFGDMLGAAAGEAGASEMERAALASDDLAYDQAELRARTVRRVRAAVGDRVADAHGVR